ncbi:OpgC domain-containing protein [Microbacterium deminutum]|uniref:OpgC domain-containing protein n=1 Tax=Microbacterium deminutum TaxID=344164 RepID=A0ABP5CGQ0_9MICO
MQIAARPRRRDLTIDVLRAFCIVSMTAAHVAAGSVVYGATHALLWFDGAMGFVLLSGLVVGMVHRATAERLGFKAARTKAWHRAGVVYAAHVAICALAFVVATLSPLQDARYAGAHDFDAWWQPVLAALTLQINPTNASILSLYVILLLLTPIATWALLRRKPWILGAMTIALYIAGQVFPDAFTLPRMPGVQGQIDWATWQALYFSALAIGWFWSAIRGRLRRPSGWTSLLVVAASAGALARVRLRVIPDAQAGSWRFVDWLFDDGALGLGTILLALAVIGGLYGALAPLSERAPRLAGELGRIGRRSLDCYVILSTFVILMPVFWRPDTRSIEAVAYGAGLLGLMWVWCWIRDRRVAKHSTRPPAEDPAGPAGTATPFSLLTESAAD